MKGRPEQERREVHLKHRGYKTAGNGKTQVHCHDHLPPSKLYPITRVSERRFDTQNSVLVLLVTISFLIVKVRFLYINISTSRSLHRTVSI